MATFEITRDMRGAAQDAKREKERSTKWAFGTRPAPGDGWGSWYPSLESSESDLQQPHKVRPGHSSYNGRWRGSPSHNIVKPKYVHDVKPNVSRAKIDAMEELNDPAISRSLIDLLPSPRARRNSVTEGFLYSFDRMDSPGRPLTLDVFVKTNPKETERLVEKEYEILDYNGDALKGRKARRNLRRRSLPQSAEEPPVVEDEGFELV